MPRPCRTDFRAAAAHALLLILTGCAAGATAVPEGPTAPDRCPAARAGAPGDTILIGVPRDESVPLRAGCPGLALDARPADGDQRDQLDAGMDVVVTRDPATIAYARGRAEFESVPLDWDRTYALVVPRRPASWLADTSAEFRRSLARDAVTAGARAAEGPFWWERDPVTCPPAAGLPPDFFRSILAYHERDRTARELAERLVAIAAAQGTVLRAAPRPDGAGIHSPRRETATVMPIPRAGSNAEACALGLGDATVVPLVDTRATAIVRRRRARVSAEPNGTLLVFPAPAPAE